MTPRLVECEGAPRDLGFDQGRALQGEIHADLRAFGVAPAPGQDARFARDLARHFPHLDERLTGLASGAGCPRDAAVALAARELSSGAAHASAEAVAGGLELRLAESLPPTGLAVRRTRPDGGYTNLSVARPGVVFGLAGVNEHGLAGVLELAQPTHPEDRCRISGALLLEQCLERLDGVEKALEWCERRPGGGAALLLFADASGATGAIRIHGDKRVRVEASPGPSPQRGAGPRVCIAIAARAIEIGGAGIAPVRFELASGS